MFQTSDSLTVNDDSLKSSESIKSLRRSDSEDPRTIQEDVEQSHYERRYRSIAFVDDLSRSGVMRHGTAGDQLRSVIQCMYTYTEATFLSTRLAVSPICPQKTYLSQVNYLSHNLD